MDAKLVLEELVDHLAPRLDVYELAIYLYVFRHSRLQGATEIVVGFKSARHEIVQGIVTKGSSMSEGTCYEKLRSLELKGCLQNLGTERGGTRLLVRLPSEIDDLIPSKVAARALDLDEMDFFEDTENRLALLPREQSRCFYCLRGVDAATYVVEHVVSRPEGNNSYRNVVAACRSCNNRKGDTSADDFLRRLYRDGFLSDAEFQGCTDKLARLLAGELKPVLSVGDGERAKSRPEVDSQG